MKSLRFNVHTPNLLNEISQHSKQPILMTPLRIFGKLLFEVGERAAQLNDPRLNELMARLTIYACADPESKHYDQKLTDTLLNWKTK